MFSDCCERVITWTQLRQRGAYNKKLEKKNRFGTVTIEKNLSGRKVMKI